MDINIRAARPDDSRITARNIMAAIDFDVYEKPFDSQTFRIFEAVAEICRREDTLYSWKNTLIAECGDIAAGSLTSYNGADYKALKAKTFGLLKEMTGFELPPMDDETGEGEWYLDSMSVLPSFRGHKIGKLLIRQSLETGEALGFETASLLVLPEKKGLVRMYSECGFSPAGELHCFGENFLKMTALLR